MALIDNTKDILTQEEFDKRLTNGYCVDDDQEEYDSMLRSHAALLDRVRELEQGWIPVSERLPENSGVFIGLSVATEKNDYNYGQIDSRPVYFELGEWLKYETLNPANNEYWIITHWQPLPAPPIAGKERTE